MTGSARRLPYVPALDSLRAIAVIGVLAYHHDPARVPGGWLGVSMFFTLSGFLIAGLLLAEHDTRGRIDLGGFWNRRIRRLLPASLVAIALSAVVVAVDVAQRGGDVARDVRAAVLHVANWHFIAQDAPYAGAESAPSPVQHYWSLAIEEQFYLVFPIVVALTLRRRLLPAVMALVIIGSVALQLALGSDVDRAYFGTDTRAAELAVGVLLAIALPGLRRELASRRWLADAAGVVALVATGLLFLGTELDADLVGSGGLTAVTVAWCGLLVAAVCGRRVPAALGRGPLPPLGRISYGVYLYHWPVYLLITADRTSLDGLSLLAVRIAVTLLLAAASSTLVELPVRRRELRLRPVLTAAGAGMAAVVLATVVVPPSDGGGALDVAASLVAPPSVSTTSTPAALTPAAPGEDAESASGDPAAPGGGTGDAAGPAPSVPSGDPIVPVAARRVPRLLVVGDSTAGVTGTALQDVGAAEGIAEVFVLNQPGCAIHQFDEAKVRDGYLYRSPCGDIIGDAVRAAGDIEPDAIVVFIGSAQLFDARYDGDDQYRSFLDPRVSDRYRERLTDAVSRLGAAGVPVLWADVPAPEWDLDEFGKLFGSPLPGSGEATSNDPARADLLNRIDEAVVGAQRHAVRWGYEAAVAGPDGRIEPAQRPDGLHLDPAQAKQLARDAIFPALEQAYQDGHARMADTLAGREPITWTPAPT